MILTCFACNATGSIEAFTKDAEASDFVNLAGNLQPAMWQALVAYIGLFRTSRKMPFKQAAKLAREVMALDADLYRLGTALCATVESMQAKREEGTFRPLKNHKYLAVVLADTPAAPVTASRVQDPIINMPPLNKEVLSKTAKAVGRLMDRKSR